MSDLIRLAGMYENESKAGNRYFVGLLNHGTKLVMLKNKHRQADNEPHWHLYITERGERPQADAKADPQSHDATAATHRPGRRRPADQRELAAEAQAPFNDDLPSELA